MSNVSWIIYDGKLSLTVVFLFHSVMSPTVLFYSRTKEVNFVVGLIRDRFNDVIQIGRDLVRLLQNVARIPEIEQVAGDTSIYIYIKQHCFQTKFSLQNSSF